MKTTVYIENIRFRLLREADAGVTSPCTESEALEFRRDQYGLTHRDFAEILDLMPSHYSEVVKGKRRLPINSVARAVAIGVPPLPLLQGRQSLRQKRRSEGIAP